jgi:hypothetical protein
MGKVFCLAVVLLSASALIHSARAIAEENADEGVLKHGVLHNIAEDRKVINVGGRFEPEGLDIYLKRRLDALTSQIEAAESRLSNQLGSVDKRLDEMNKRLTVIESAFGSKTESAS